MALSGAGADPSRSDQEFQLETRHLVSLIALVVVLCIASFMLGRWVERQNPGSSLSGAVSTGGDRQIEDAGDVAKDLTFFDTLKGNDPAPLTPTETIAPAQASTMTPTNDPPAPKNNTQSAAGTIRRSVNDGVMIQVLVSRDRASAEALRRKLRTKGFTVAIIPERGSYKVRVGPYADRGEAERIASILREQERLSTWIP